ncbi:hypothetical protein D9M71_263490 [compost metagenome]
MHAARVGPHRFVEVFANFCECLDVSYGQIDLFRAEAHQASGVIDVLAACQFRIETHAQFENCGDAAVYLDGPLGGLEGAGDHLQQGRFAGAILTNDANGFSGLDGKADVPKYPMFFRGLDWKIEPAGNALPFRTIATVSLSQVLYAQQAHSTSTISALALRNTNRPSPRSDTLISTMETSDSKCGVCPYTSTAW